MYKLFFDFSSGHKGLILILQNIIDFCSPNIDRTLVLSFQGLFPPGQGATIGVDFMIKTVEIDGEKIKVSQSGIL